MDKNNVLKMDDGILYLKLQEDFNADSLEVRTTIAKITIDEAVIVMPQGSDGIALSHYAIGVLSEGSDMVSTYWDAELAHRQVLLSCGCAMDWDEYMNEIGEKDIPVEIEEAYCEECHDEALILRVNRADFK